MGPFPAAIVVVAIYCCIQIVVLPLLSHWAGTGVGVDDAEQLMRMQRFFAGYGGSQPPLYTWINWAVSLVFGTSIFTLKFVKYSVIFVAFWATFAAMRQLDYRRATASTAMFGLFTVPLITWESQRALSHSIGVLGCCALLILSAAHLFKRANLRSYALFGLAMGAAALAKYNDLLLVLAVVASLLSLRTYRATVLNSKMLMAIGIAGLAVAPTAYWNLTHRADVLARQSKLGIHPGQAHLEAAGDGLIALFLAMVDFALIPTLIYGFALLVARSRTEVAAPPKEQFIWRTLCFGLAIVTALVLVSGSTEIRGRWLLPVLFALPLAAAAHIDRLQARGHTAQKFIIGSGATLALLSMVVTWYFQINGGTGQANILQMNYPALYQALSTDGPIRTVVSDKPFVGNLRLVDETLITMDDETANFSDLLEDPIVLVWLNTDAPDASILARIASAGYRLKGTPQSYRPVEADTKRLKRVVFVRLER